jgi:hypothetical protein
MAETFGAALLGHLHRLPDGSSVRLRLARSSDAGAIRDLLLRAGADAADLGTARLVHFDPRRRYVLCASALVGSSEQLLAVGAIDFGDRSDRRPEPSLLLVGGPHGPELSRLLTVALVEVASERARSRAA